MDGARLSTGGNAQVTSALASISSGGMYRMHLHNGILHLAVAARPAMPQMSEARDQMAAREESQAAGMFRAAVRNEGFCFVSRGRCFDQSPDLISRDPAEQKKKKTENPQIQGWCSQELL